MSVQKSKRVRIQILNPIGGCGHTSLAHAKRYVRRGTAEWVGGAIQFIERVRPVSPAVGLSNFYGVCDSGFCGFLSYPFKAGGTGQQYPALARKGAGLL